MAWPSSKHLPLTQTKFHQTINTEELQTTWIFVILGNTYDIKLGEWRADANSLLSAQEFWFAVFMTVLYVSTQVAVVSIADLPSVLIPWFTLREVPVEVEIVSFALLSIVYIHSLTTHRSHHRKLP
jgi:hypothetical protein